jgi:drug/metabolite transporter (DMT)-like permease
MEVSPPGGNEIVRRAPARWNGSATRAGGFRPVGTGLACALSSGVCFSVSTVCAQKALDTGLPVVVVAGARPVIACILLFLVTMVAGRQAITGRVRLRLMGAGLFTAAQIFLLYQSVERISAPLAVLLLYSYPALVAALSVTFLRERLGLLKVAAVAISLAGAVLIVGVPAGRGTVIGFVCGLGAGLSLAVYIVLTSRVARGISPLSAVAWIQLGAAIVYLPGLAGLAGSRTALGSLGWLLPVGLSAGIATALFLASLQRLGPTTASIASTIEPISTAALSAVVLGVTLTATQTYGGLLIVAALVLISLDGARRRGATVSSP